MQTILNNTIKTKMNLYQKYILAYNITFAALSLLAITAFFVTWDIPLLGIYLNEGLNFIFGALAFISFQWLKITMRNLVRIDGRLKDELNLVPFIQFLLDSHKDPVIVLSEDDRICGFNQVAKDWVLGEHITHSDFFDEIPTKLEVAEHGGESRCFVFEGADGHKHRRKTKTTVVASGAHIFKIIEVIRVVEAK